MGGEGPHIFEGFPGPPGPARPQKRTPKNPARLPSSTQCLTLAKVTHGTETMGMYRAWAKDVPGEAPNFDVFDFFVIVGGPFFGVRFGGPKPLLHTIGQPFEVNFT